MPGILPASRPVITDAEVWNRPDVGSLARKMIHWQQYTYCRDVMYVPHDPAPSLLNPGSGARAYPVHQDPNVSVYSNANDLGVSLPKVTPVSGTWTSCSLGSFYVPDSLSGAKSLALRIYVVFDTVNADAAIRVTFVPSTGSSVNVDIDWTVLPLGYGWVSVSWPCAKDVVVQITATYTGVQGVGNFARVESICGWWEPAVDARVTVETGRLKWVKQGWGAEERPDNIHLLRWLQRSAARLSAERARVVVSRYYGKTRFLFGSGATARQIGRWMLPVGPSGLSGTTKNVYLGHDIFAAAGAVTIYVNGSGSTLSALALGGILQTHGFSVTPPSALTEVEVRLEVVANGSTGGFTSATFVESRESSFEAFLGLPSGDTCPSAFPSMDATAIGAGSPITADLRNRLIQGMMYLLTRQERCLASQTVALGAPIWGAFLIPMNPVAGAAGRARASFLIDTFNGAAPAPPVVAAVAHTSDSNPQTAPPTIVNSELALQLISTSQSPGEMHVFEGNLGAGYSTSTPTQFAFYSGSDSYLRLMGKSMEFRVDVVP